MRKNVFLTLIASALFASTLTSCDAFKGEYVIVEKTGEQSVSSLRRQAYYQMSKHDGVTSSYGDFWLNAKMSKNEEASEILFEYNKSSICLGLDGTLKYKEIYSPKTDIFNENTLRRWDYINGSWLETRYNLNNRYEEVTTYDNNGNKLTFERSEFVAGRLTKTREYRYINDKEYNTYIIYLDSDNHFSSKSEFEYDDKGNRLLAKDSNYENGVWVCESLSRTTYDDKGNMLTKESFDYLDGLINTININECTYDDNGRLLTDVESYMSGSSAWSYGKTENTYDERGNKTLEVYSYYQDGAWKYAGKNECTYDENNNVTLYVGSYYDVEWEYSIKYEYTYDEKGNRISTASYRFKNGQWVEEEKR